MNIFTVLVLKQSLGINSRLTVVSSIKPKDKKPDNRKEVHP